MGKGCDVRREVAGQRCAAQDVHDLDRQQVWGCERITREQAIRPCTVRSVVDESGDEEFIGYDRGGKQERWRATRTDLIFGSNSYWRDPGSGQFPQGLRIPAAAEFSRFGNTRVHLGLIVALITVAAVTIATIWSRKGIE